MWSARAGLAGEVEENVFGAASYGFDAAALKEGFDLIGRVWQRDARAQEARGDNAPAGDGGADFAADGFDFRQLRHRRSGARGEVAQAVPIRAGVFVLADVDDAGAGLFQKIHDAAAGMAVHFQERLGAAEEPPEMAISEFERAAHAFALAAADGGGQLEQQRASGREQTHEFAQVAAAEARVHVLERDVGVNEIEVGGGERAQVPALVENVFAAIGEAVVAAGEFDHRRGNVYANDGFEVAGQGLGQPAGAATEIERVFFRGQWVSGFKVIHDAGDFPDAGGEELIHVPAVVVLARRGEDGPIRIALAEDGPLPLQRSEAHLPLSSPSADEAWDNRTVAKPRELEHRLERAGQELRLLQKISRYLVRDIPLQEALNGVVSLVVEFMDCDSCLLYRLEGRDLILCASNTAQASAVGRVRLSLDEGLTGWVARERRLLAIFREAYRDPRFKTFTDLPEDTFEAFLSAPLITRKGVAGVINVQHRDAHAHTGGEMELLATVGELTGCLLELSKDERGTGDGERALQSAHTSAPDN